MMRQVELYTRDNGYVTTVLIPSMTPLLEGIRWGERMFMRGMDYVYREGVIWVVRGRSTRCPKERSRASRPNEFSSEVHESVLGPELRISN